MSRLSREGKAIYGFNRGVGWNKDQNIDESFFAEQNRKIIRSHCLGTPEYNTDAEVRAMMAIRLNNLLIGASCASDGLANIYRDFLNHGLTPRIPKKGSVGEADITTISHMGLAFIGEGEVSSHEAGHGGRGAPAPCDGAEGCPHRHPLQLPRGSYGRGYGL